MVSRFISLMFALYLPTISFHFVRYWPKAGMTLADISQCDWTTVQLDRLAGITFNSCSIRAATARCPTKASCTFGIQESDICGVLMLVSVLFRAPLGH